MQYDPNNVQGMDGIAKKMHAMFPNPGHQSTAVANQAAQFQQNDRMVRALENMEQLRQLSNPVAPAPGGTRKAPMPFAPAPSPVRAKTQ